MQTFIVTRGNSSDRALYISALVNPQVELIHLQTEKSAITIKQVRELTNSLINKPRLPRIVWIEEADNLTHPAQNALLKILEEPPEQTSFYLTCNSHLELLATIRSRAKLIALGSQESTSGVEILAELKLVMAESPGDRIQAIPKRDRAEAIAWLQKIEVALRSKLKQSSLSTKNYQMLAGIAKLTLEAHDALARNASISLTMQTYYLLLPHTHPSK